AFLWFAALAALAFAAIQEIAKVDWYFLFQTLLAAAVWLAAFAAIYSMTRGNRAPRHSALALSVGVVAAMIVAIGSPVIGKNRPALTLALDRYSPYDASLILLARLMKPSSGELADVAKLLEANTNVSGERRSRTASIDFVSHLEPSRSAKPNIFFFVVD